MLKKVDGNISKFTEQVFWENLDIFKFIYIYKLNKCLKVINVLILWENIGIINRETNAIKRAQWRPFLLLVMNTGSAWQLKIFKLLVEYVEHHRR